MDNMYQTTKFTIEDADNGLILRYDEMVSVIKDSGDEIVIELGKILRDEIRLAMDNLLANEVDIELKITKHETN